MKKQWTVAIVLGLFLVLTVHGAWAADVEMSGNVGVSGSLTATSLSGDGSAVTNIAPNNITSGTANINISGNADSATTATTANSVTAGAVSTGGLAVGAVTPAKIAFYGKVAIVAPGGGDYNNPATAMTDSGSWCGTPSSTNPCLLKIMPGIYDIGTSPVVMQSYIDVEGSGENVTVIEGSVEGSSSGALEGANDAELRFLTVKNTGAGGYVIAIYNEGSSPKLTNVTAIASGSTDYNYALYNDNSSPVMTDVTAAASDGTYCYGVYNSYSSPVMNNVTATAAGGINDYGVRNDISSSPEMINVTAKASGGTDGYGVYNYNSSSPVMSNVTAKASGSDSSYGVYDDYCSPVMRNVSASASGATNNYGVWNLSSSPVIHDMTASAVGGADSYGVYNTDSSFTMSNVTASASGGTNGNYGVEEYASGTLKINHSVIKGATNTVLNDSSGATIYVGDTQLDGGAVSGTVTCAGVYDENYTFLANTCP